MTRPPGAASRAARPAATTTLPIRISLPRGYHGRYVTVEISCLRIRDLVRGESRHVAGGPIRHVRGADESNEVVLGVQLGRGLERQFGLHDVAAVGVAGGAIVVEE